MEETPSPADLDAPAPAQARFEQVVLVGFMGSGKTEVGRHLAELLGWQFIDSDQEIQQEMGLSVAEIFRQLGEPAFREAERRTVNKALEGTHVVVSTGGGWAAQEGTMESVPERAFVGWLQVTSEEALRRLGSTSGRPLLDRPDASAYAEDLLRRRVKRYALAHHLYDTASATPQEIAGRIRSAVWSPVAGTTTKEE